MERNPFCWIPFQAAFLVKDRVLLTFAECQHIEMQHTHLPS